LGKLDTKCKGLGKISKNPICMCSSGLIHFNDFDLTVYVYIRATGYQQCSDVIWQPIVGKGAKRKVTGMAQGTRALHQKRQKALAQKATIIGRLRTFMEHFRLDGNCTLRWISLHIFELGTMMRGFERK